MTLSTLSRLRSRGVLLIVSWLLALAGCGGGGGAGGGGGETPPPPATISVEGFVSGLAGSGLILSNNGSDNLAVGTNGGFVFAKPLSDGDPYNVTITTQPNNPMQNCSVLNGSGTGTVTTGNVTTVAVACLSAGRFLYVTGTNCTQPSDCILAYSIDATTGALTAVPSSPYRGSAAFSYMFSVDPSSRFAFVADGGSPASVLASTIDHATGALTAVAGSPFMTPMLPAFADAIGVDPSGNFLYVAGTDDVPNGTGSVAVFMVDITTGALSPLAAGPYATGAGAKAVTFDPSGKFVYVGYNTTEPPAVFYIAAFARGATTGALAAVPGSPFLTEDANSDINTALSASVTVNPNGKFLYVTGPGFALNPNGTFAYSQSDILAYAINPSSGALTPLAGNPFIIDGNGIGINAFAIDGTTGALTVVQGSPFVPLAGNTFSTIAVDPSGNFAYANTGESGSIYVFSINAGTGALTAIAGSPFPGSGPGVGCCAMPASIVVSK